jgi:hypothetical protein
MKLETIRKKARAKLFEVEDILAGMVTAPFSCGRRTCGTAGKMGASRWRLCGGRDRDYLPGRENRFPGDRDFN